MFRQSEAFNTEKGHSGEEVEGADLDGYKGLDQPTPNPPTRFRPGLTLDGLKSSHPIEVEVNHARQVDEIFDAISYAKVCACFRRKWAVCACLCGGRVFMCARGAFD